MDLHLRSALDPAAFSISRTTLDYGPQFSAASVPATSHADSSFCEIRRVRMTLAIIISKKYVCLAESARLEPVEYFAHS